MRDGPTMTDAQIEKWQRDLQAQRNHKAKYKGQPGTPLTINAKKAALRRIEKPVSGCKHHWRIEEVHGPTCEGLCLICGVTRTYSTAGDDSPQFQGSLR